MPVIPESYGMNSDQFCTIGDQRWSIHRLIALSEELPFLEIPLEHLNLELDMTLGNCRELASHVDRVDRADLSKPIILDENGVLMDGRHRITRAIWKKKKTIIAVRFEKNPVPCSENTV